MAKPRDQAELSISYNLLQHFKKHCNYHNLSYLVDISTAFADIPFGITLAFTSFNFDKSCVFVLIPQTALESGEQALGVQLSRLGSHLLFVVLRGKGKVILKLVEKIVKVVVMWLWSFQFGGAQLA